MCTQREWHVHVTPGGEMHMGNSMAVKKAASHGNSGGVKVSSVPRNKAMTSPAKPENMISGRLRARTGLSLRRQHCSSAHA